MFHYHKITNDGSRYVVVRFVRVSAKRERVTPIGTAKDYNDAVSLARLDQYLASQ